MSEEVEALVGRLRDQGHMTQRDGLAALLETAGQAASALSAGQVRGEGESRDHAPSITAVTSGQPDGWRE